MRKEKCLFCEWAQLLHRLERSKVNRKKLKKDHENWYRYQYLDKSQSFFAVLDKYPKVIGHTLIISRYHYSDIADPRLSNLQLTQQDSDLIRRIIGKLKGLTNDKSHGKVYMMSMC